LGAKYKMTSFKKFTYKLGGLACLLATATLFTCEKVPDYCGKGEWYNPDFQFCFARKAYDLCGNNHYNPFTEGCMRGNTVGTLCVDEDPVPLGTPCDGYTLSTASAPADGGDIAITRTSPGPNFAAGEMVTLIAQERAGYEFAGWAGAQPSSDAAITLTMSSNKPMVAMFKPNTLTLATTAFPPSGGDIDRTPNSDGTQVTVTATPTDGHTFTNWEGASTSTQATITVTVDEGKTLVAMFTPDRYTLTVNANPPVGGMVFVNNTASTGATQHDAGAQVQVLARAVEGYEFVGWAGAATSTNAEIAVTMNSSQTLSANFRQQTVTPTTYTLTVSSSPSAGGTVTGGGTFNAGTNAAISATANAGYAFTGWTGGGVTNSGLANTTVSMTADRTVTANFSLISPPTGDTLVDDRDGQMYRIVTIGTQVWMAENLNWAGDDGNLGVCYGNSASNCDLYGRLYDWSTAMELPSSCNGSICANQVQSRHRGICPQGWHVPSDAEWTTLTDFVGGSSTAGRELKSTTGWSGGNGTDNFGFSALPGGCRNAGGSFYNVGGGGYWWSATESDATYWYVGWSSRNVSRHYSNEGVAFSLRCLED
jgi:uncharacterized protein (TIGR02145 family)/uncharacterized repeat protein (TIGR02543 family)